LVETAPAPILTTGDIMRSLVILDGDRPWHRHVRGLSIAWAAMDICTTKQSRQALVAPSS